MSIPVSNVYYLLCYAWGERPDGDIVERGDAGEFDRIADLFGSVLARGVLRLTRRGVARDYVDRREPIAGIRGKIDFGATLRSHALLYGRTVCEFDDLSQDVPKNRTLATTLDQLLLAPLGSEVREQVQLARDRLGRLTPIRLSEGVFSRVRLGQSRRQYRFLLEVARLLYRCRLVNEHDGTSAFREVSLADLEGWRVFERFVQRFFELEQSAFQVTAQTRVQWADLTGPGQEHVQSMQPDLVLQSRDRRMVLDTKYYSEPLVNRYGTQAVHSGNLYQLFAYVMNLQATRDAGPHWSGMLLYAAVERGFRVEFETHGHRMEARSVDLRRPWQEIEGELLALLDRGPAAPRYQQQQE